MSGMDFVYSIKTFISTCPLPASNGTFGAMGTTATCAAAGFFGQGGSLSSVVYNGTLTWYYLPTIRQGWTHRKFQGVEWFLHFVPLAIGWGTAVAALILDLYNPIGWTCWIGPWPYGCDKDDTCERGSDAKLFRCVFFHGICWAVFAFVLVAVGMIFWKIYKDESVLKILPIQLST